MSAGGMGVLASWVALLLGLALLGGLLGRRRTWRRPQRELLAVAIVLLALGASGVGWPGR